MISQSMLLLVANVLPLIGLLATPVILFVSLFFFDAPGSTRNPFVIGMALAVWTYPITASIGGFFAIRAYRINDVPQMFSWTLCTYSSIAVFVACFTFASIASLVSTTS